MLISAASARLVINSNEACMFSVLPGTLLVLHMIKTLFIEKKTAFQFDVANDDKLEIYVLASRQGSFSF